MAGLQNPTARALLDTVVNSMDQGVLVVNADLTVPFLSARTAELIDLPAEFAKNPPSFRDILQYQVDTNAITERYMVSTINDLILRGDKLFEKHIYTRKTPSGRWLDVRTTPLPGGGFVRTFTDQTEQHRLESQKRLSDTAYRTLFENAAVGIYQSSPDGRQIRANPELVALNGYHQEADLLNAVQNIGTEWYVDPNRRAEFREIMQRDGRVSQFESEIYRHLTRERIWVSETAWTVTDEDGNITGYQGTVAEITERKKMETMITHAAHHDSLTGLPNRASFNLDLDRALENRSSFFLAYMDLDGFKSVNDSHGHRVGDELLVAIANRLMSTLRDGNRVYRMGGDEFAVLLTGGGELHAIGALDRIIDTLEAPFAIRGIRICIGVSIGLIASANGETTADLLHLADTGLYHAKGAQGSAISFEGDLVRQRELFESTQPLVRKNLVSRC